jgi:hypothetical protein
MALYNVIQPCVVGTLHHARATTQPIDVDDDTAAPLVKAGCLEPVDGVYVAPRLAVGFVEAYPHASDESAPEVEPPATPRRRARKD